MQKKIILFTAVLACSLSLQALSFGKNKVIYRGLEWRIIETGNFYVYYNTELEPLARDTALIAEGAYTRITKSLKVFPAEKIKLFIYKDHIDFEQTNITSELITEGVGGFTEPLKDRIVLPVYTSMNYYKHVIEHEFTHRLQFEVLFGGFGKSMKLARSLLIPLWFMEGMADHEAGENDAASANLLLRDAVINGRTHTLSYLGSFNYEDGRDVVLMYKEAKSFFDFVEQTYGEEKIGAVLREFYLVSITPEQAFFNILGVSLEELNKKWQYWLKEKYWAQAIGRKQGADYGAPATFDRQEMQVNNTRPVFSADGSKLYYISDRNNYSGLCELELKNNSRTELIGHEYDFLSNSGNALAVSPDGKLLAFAARVAGKAQLHIYYFAERRVIKSFNCGLDGVYSPRFISNSRLLFSGDMNGVSDIYSSDIAGGNLKKITEDAYDDSDPGELNVEAPFGVLMDSFSGPSEAKDLIYVSERNLKRVLVQVSNFESKDRTEKVLTPGTFNTWSPVPLRDGRILCVSDLGGIQNIYIFDRAKQEFLQA
ncbi:MAG: peptidase MA family metallohydrolase, partial [Candidatus Firestonebacteria bacterium]